MAYHDGSQDPSTTSTSTSSSGFVRSKSAMRGSSGVPRNGSRHVSFADESDYAIFEYGSFEMSYSVRNPKRHYEVSGLTRAQVEERYLLCLDKTVVLARRLVASVPTHHGGPKVVAASSSSKLSL
eukprot:TRINITY_DN71641_c0_g1_i1.p1 TRINITY_DN71641_c0_g1~~TRINITY_DN71641_c0_g1_i1.p1  ORF type:complete len:125 (-),score=8.19 TRINITY_DN71641_c0_g1_i1:69-443(-)